jgi:hypothetical protein
MLRLSSGTTADTCLTTYLRKMDSYPSRYVNIESRDSTLALCVNNSNVRDDRIRSAYAFLD